MKFEKLNILHNRKLLAFELENRDYFESMISKRSREFYTIEGINHHINGFNRDASDSPIGLLAIESVHQQIVARANIHQIDLQNSSCEIGYRVAQQHSGKGIATACIGKLTGIARDVLGLKRVTARVLDNNPASKKALLKSGFEYTGNIGDDVEVLNDTYRCQQYTYMTNQ